MQVEHRPGDRRGGSPELLVGNVRFTRPRARSSARPRVLRSFGGTDRHSGTSQLYEWRGPSAMSGERLVITIDGVPAAQLGPLNTGEQPLEIPDLIAAGLLIAPRSTAPPMRPTPVRAAPGSPSSSEILEQDRNR